MIKFVESGGTEGNEPADDEDEDYDDEDVSLFFTYCPHANFNYFFLYSIMIM